LGRLEIVCFALVVVFFGICFLFDQHGGWWAFGRDLSFGVDIGLFAEFFSVCPAWVHRPGKKIESWEILDFLKKWEIFRLPIFLPSL
jgi:hypothetical protein